MVSPSFSTLTCSNWIGKDRLVKYAVSSQLISKQVLILIAEGLGRLAGIDKVGQFLKLVADVVGDQINADKN